MVAMINKLSSDILAHLFNTGTIKFFRQRDHRIKYHFMTRIIKSFIKNLTLINLKLALFFQLLNGTYNGFNPHAGHVG